MHQEGYILSDDEFQSFMNSEFVKLTQEDFLSIKSLYKSGELEKVILLVDQYKEGNKLVKEMMIYR